MRLMDSFGMVALFLLRDYSLRQDRAIEERFLASLEMTGDWSSAEEGGDFGKTCQRLPFFASSRRYSEARQESAMIVSVGFLSGLVTSGAPSVTNTFFTSCAWQKPLSTGFRISAHPRGAHLVNNLAAFLNPKRKVTVDGSPGSILAAHGLDDGAKRLLHVLGLQQLVIRPLEVEAQRGNAPLLDNVGIDLAISVRVGNHFAASGEADMRAVDLARALLQCGPVAFFFIAQIIEHADDGHVASPAKFDVIAAGKIIFAVEFPPRHVHVHSAYAVVIVRRHLLQLRKVARTTAANGIGEIS